jgi:hypothetical protein
MKKAIVLTALFLSLLSPLFAGLAYMPSYADKIVTHEEIIKSGKNSDNTTILDKKTNLTVKELKKLKQGRLSFKEKLSFILLKKYLKKQNESGSEGQTAFIFGIVAIGFAVLGLILPYLFLISIIPAILAIVFAGFAPIQDNKARVGKLLVWITLGLVGLVLILAVAILAAFF